MIMLVASEENRNLDAIDEDVQKRCWAFSLNHHGRKDAEGKVYEDCGRNACDCYRSHSDPEQIGSEALDRMEKLRNTQLEKLRKSKEKKGSS